LAKKKVIDPLAIKGNSEVAKSILRLLLMKESSYRCQECGKRTKRLEIHHRDGCGLNWKRENLMVLCPMCHRLKSNLEGSGRRSKELRIPEYDYFSPKLPPLSKHYLHAQYDRAHPRAK